MKLEFDAYLVDTLMPDLVGHDRQPTAFLVLLFLWSECSRSQSSAVQKSLREIAEGTGTSRRSVQAAVARLKQRRLIKIRRGSITDIPEYHLQTPWRR